MSAFGQRLRQLRQNAGMSQEGLARAANMSLSAYCKIELKNVDPAFSTAAKLAKALGLSVSAFEVSAADAEQPAEEQTPPKRKPKKR